MLLVCLLAVCAIASAADKPNILFVLTDDQDIMLGGSDHIPKITRLVGDAGVHLANMFANTPVCCPSRSTFITGRLIHNIPVFNNSLDGNCSSTSFINGPEKLGISTFIQAAGYRTGYFGKYLNQYGYQPGGISHVPPGWTDWVGLLGNSQYYNYTLSINGTAENHGVVYSKDYLTDVLANRSLAMITDSMLAKQPFFAVVATPSCHDPTEPAPQYAWTFENKTAPRTPNYNKFWQDKNVFVRTEGGSMTELRQQVSDLQYRRRLETLMSVDDLVERLVTQIDQMGQLHNTYVFYTSDHGYHLGQFGLMKDKRTPYEFDIRTPGYVRGPGIKPGTKTNAVINMVDFPATLLDIAGVVIPEWFDGTSILKHLHDGERPSRSFLMEYHGETSANPFGVCVGHWSPVIGCWIEGPEMSLIPPEWHGNSTCSCQDMVANEYWCVRTMNATRDTTFCQWADGFVEYYNVTHDKWQTVNQVSTLSPAQLSVHKSELQTLRGCMGSSCVLHYA